MALLTLAGCAGYSILRLLRPTEHEHVAEATDDTLSRAEMAYISAVEKGTALLNPRTMVKMDAGHFLTPITVFQVQDDRAFLGKVDGELIMFAELDASALVNGRTWEPPPNTAFVCLGPYTYPTANNSQNTVSAVVPISTERIMRLLREEKARREKAGRTET